VAWCEAHESKKPAVDRTSGIVSLPNGVEMPFLEQGDRSGVPLLLLHAVGDSQRIFEGLLDALPPALHAVVPTFRGHGDAGRPATGYRSSDLAADLVAFMDALRIEAAAVAGGSSGGLVAQRAALDFPGRVLGLVLLGSPLTFTDKPAAQELWASTVSKLSDPIDQAFVRGFLLSTLSRPAEDARLDVLVEESLKVPAAVWKATLDGVLHDDFSAELGRIGVPTLVVWGDADTVLPREDQETLARLIPGGRLVVYEGAGHVFYWEDPSRVAADLASFLGRLAWARGPRAGPASRLGEATVPECTEHP
jgi:pimeloyl-ACP methyl ester carboxylesterase